MGLKGRLLTSLWQILHFYIFFPIIGFYYFRSNSVVFSGDDSICQVFFLTQGWKRLTSILKMVLTVYYLYRHLMWFHFNVCPFLHISDWVWSLNCYLISHWFITLYFILKVLWKLSTYFAWLFLPIFFLNSFFSPFWYDNVIAFRCTRNCNKVVIEKWWQMKKAK